MEFHPGKINEQKGYLMSVGLTTTRNGMAIEEIDPLHFCSQTPHSMPNIFWRIWTAVFSFFYTPFWESTWNDFQIKIRSSKQELQIENKGMEKQIIDYQLLNITFQRLHARINDVRNKFYTKIIISAASGKTISDLCNKEVVASLSAHYNQIANSSLLPIDSPVLNKFALNKFLLQQMKLFITTVNELEDTLIKEPFLFSSHLSANTSSSKEMDSKKEETGTLTRDKIKLPIHNLPEIPD